MTDMFKSIEMSARTRLLELEGLYSDLVEMRPAERDEVTDRLIVLREVEIARVLDIITRCQQSRPSVVASERARARDR